MRPGGCSPLSTQHTHTQLELELEKLFSWKRVNWNQFARQARPVDSSEVERKMFALGGNYLIWNTENGWCCFTLAADCAHLKEHTLDHLEMVVRVAQAGYFLRKPKKNHR